MKKTVIAGLVGAGFFFLLNIHTTQATEDIYTDAIHVLRKMEEKIAAVKMCSAGLLEKEKETKFVFERVIETCACCPDVYRCCYTVDCNPCFSENIRKRGRTLKKKP